MSILCRDDVVEILEATRQGENCLCSSKWLADLADKVTNTLNELQQLRDQVELSYDNQKTPLKHLNENKVVWSGQLMYKHRGFSIPRFEDLGLFSTDLKEEAIKSANEIAQKWVDDNFKEKEIEYWDVKVKPANLK